MVPSFLPSTGSGQSEIQCQARPSTGSGPSAGSGLSGMKAQACPSTGSGRTEMSMDRGSRGSRVRSCFHAKVLPLPNLSGNLIDCKTLTPRCVTSIAACNILARSGSLFERAPSIPKSAFSTKLMRVVSVAGTQHAPRSGNLLLHVRDEQPVSR